MKVLHITTSVSKHSACNRIHEALLENNIQSQILVLRGFGECNEYIVKTNRIKKKVIQYSSYLVNKIIENKNREVKPVFSIGMLSVDITRDRLIKESDIIHLHWFNDGLLSIRDIYKLSKMGKKIIWTMHDSWGFTGGCHVRYECNRYEKGCNKCPLLNSRSRIDITYLMWKIKKRYYNRSDFIVIVPSEKHRQFAIKSNLLKDKLVDVINNPIDVRIYRRIDKNIAREVLGLPKNKKIILFGAVNVKNKYKGYEYIIKCLEKYNEKVNNINDVEICVFGTNKFEEVERIGYKVKCLGTITDQIMMNLVYAASDVFVSPSIEESFGQTFLESILSGTPAVGFENTGAEDIIVHKNNGYLAKYKDVEDLTNGIYECIYNIQEFIVDSNRFTYKRIADKYIDIYEQVLKGLM